MQYIKKLIFIFSPLYVLFANFAYADFDYVGAGTLQYPTGAEKAFKFGFAWQASSNKFRIGDKSYEMSELPESYSIAITLSKDKDKVWVQEFNKGFIEGFEWKLGKHQLSLKKQDFKGSVIGNYQLTFNKIDYFLARPNISVEISFTEEGIGSIKLDGVTKDMGMKN